MSDDPRPPAFCWLPPGLRPPVAMAWRQEHVFLLVGAAALFAGYDTNVFGLAIPQIQASLHIPENQVGADRRLFPAGDVRRHADLRLRRSGGAAAAAAGHHLRPGHRSPWRPPSPTIMRNSSGRRFCTRVFGYAEEMLCFVVIAEEVAAAARGWASGTLERAELYSARASPRWCSRRSISCPMAGGRSMWSARCRCSWSPICAAACRRRSVSRRRKACANARSKLAETHGAAARSGAAISRPHR